MTRRLTTAAATVLAVGLCTAQAQVLTVRNMSAALAKRIAEAGIEVCAAKGHRVMVTVVDRGGNVMATLRMDGVGNLSVDSAYRKAVTALSLNNSTEVMRERFDSNPASANNVFIPGILVLGGGMPVKLGNETIGAFGIGGAPGGHLDDQCAKEALDKVKDHITPV
jgi:uncharacterized protein GlcG (DUF336 family)